MPSHWVYILRVGPTGSFRKRNKRLQEFTPDMVRSSTGLEDADNLIYDFDKVLKML
jgi:cystathionine beta-lyase/cystathionine gamma-synthase